MVTCFALRHSNAAAKDAGAAAALHLAEALRRGAVTQRLSLGVREVFRAHAAGLRAKARHVRIRQRRATPLRPAVGAKNRRVRRRARLFAVAPHGDKYVGSRAAWQGRSVLRSRRRRSRTTAGGGQPTRWQTHAAKHHELGRATVNKNSTEERARSY